MTAALILWGHALAALLFGALGLAASRGTERGWPRRSFAAALLMTALWALAVAGIDADDVSIALAEGGRSIAWLCFAAALVRRARAGGSGVAALYAVVIGVTAAAAMLALATDPRLGTASLATVAAARDALHALALLGALLLLSHLAQAVRGDGRWIALALGTMWGGDLVLSAAALLHADGLAAIGALRGAAMAAAAVLLAVAAHRGDVGPPSVSRSAIVRSLAALAVACYFGATAWAVDLAATLPAGQARAAQAAIVFGATAALLTFASTPWLRAWARVKLAKHLFPHRYDYRVEWQRFTATLGTPGEGDPLRARVVKAIADLTDSPAGLLLCVDGGALATAAAWNWPQAGTPAADARFAALLATGHIVALDGIAPDAAPDWLVADPQAWVVVPLLHGDALIGAIVLARPPIDRQLDWEDLDLLRVAGRQAASYLAEDRAHAALADAARFDEFNRRFAFLLHDIKNVASQLSLVARNAERHADNPEFRADMVATLRDGAGRMSALLSRLGQHDGGRPEPLQPVDIGPLARRVAAARRAGHPVETAIAADALALAQPGRLEQALGHLVQNAAEASDGAPVRLPVRIVIAPVGAAIAIDVVDRGYGMSADFVRDQLFRPFVSAKPGGFGIGAYEARQLVRAMGGTLEVESREGEGTRFRILLPVAPALEAAA